MAIIMMNNTSRTWEVYGAGVGFLGYVTAKTERGAKTVARRLFAGIESFAVNVVS